MWSKKDGEKMVVRPANANIECSARATAYTTGATLRLTDINDVILKQVKLWFSPGCRALVQLRITLNGNVILPDPLNNYSDSYIGDDVLLPIYLSLRLHQGDLLQVDFINTDYSAHTVSVQYEFQPLAAPPMEIVTEEAPPVKEEDLVEKIVEKVKELIVPPAAAAKPPEPPPVIPRPKVSATPVGTEREETRDYVERLDKHGRVVDESERGYAGDWEADLPEWQKTPGYPDTPVTDPRKPRRRD